MDQEKLQSELDRLRAILLAAIDYNAKKETIHPKANHADYINNYHRLWKEQVEKQYAEKSLVKLEKSLEHLTVVYRVTADLNYVNFIKENTGYDLDLFGNIDERVQKILKKGSIANTKEHMDIATMVQLYRRSGKGQENAPVLHNLSMAYFAALHEKKKSKGGLFHAVKYLKEINSPNNQKFLTMRESGHEFGNPSTYIDLTLESGTLTSVYAVDGIDLGLTIYWKNNQAITIETRKQYKKIIRRDQIPVSDGIINVEYIES